MTSAEPVLCRLEVVAADAPHRGTVLEARPRGTGFSVWLRNEQLCPDGTEIGASSQPYSARALAQIMFEYDIAERLYHSHGAWNWVSVTGERGLKAYLLRLAFTSGRFGYRDRLEMPDAAFGAFDELAGDTFDDDGPGLLFGIKGTARVLKLDLDVPALLRRYDLAANTATLRDLYDALDREWQQREDERLAPLDPFVDRIEWMVAALEVSLRPYKMSWPADNAVRKIWSLKKLLQDYALAHSRLPTGRTRIPEKVDPSHGGHEAFDVDFDALTAEAAKMDAPPAWEYRLPRRKRVPFFRRQIDALANAFGEGAFVTPDAHSPHHRRLLMGSFLEDYVVHHECLPRGTVRADWSSIPFRRNWHDLGEVDFDELCSAAGVANDIEAPVHSRGEPAS